MGIYCLVLISRDFGIFKEEVLKRARGIFSALLVGIVFMLNAQDKAAEIDVTLDFIEYSDSQSFVDVRVVYSNSSHPATGVLCNLYLTEISREGMMGSGITNSNGIIRFPLVNKFKNAAPQLSEYTFINRIANDPRFVSRDDTASFKPNHITVQDIQVSKQRRNRVLLIVGAIVIVVGLLINYRLKRSK